jgi:hypothetical protein
MGQDNVRRECGQFRRVSAKVDGIGPNGCRSARCGDPIAKTRAWLNQMLRGHLNYLYRLRKQPEPVVVLQRGEMALGKVAQTTQPASIHELGEVYQHH